MHGLGQAPLKELLAVAVVYAASPGVSLAALRPELWLLTPAVLRKHCPLESESAVSATKNGRPAMTRKRPRSCDVIQQAITDYTWNIHTSRDTMPSAQHVPPELAPLHGEGMGWSQAAAAGMDSWPVCDLTCYMWSIYKGCHRVEPSCVYTAINLIHSV